MYKLLFTLLFLLFMSNSYSQINENFSNNQLIGKFNSHVSIVKVGNELKLKDASLNTFFNNLGIENITLLSKGKSKRKIHEEIVLLEFKNEVSITSMIAAISEKGIFRYLEPNFIGYIDGGCVNIPDDTYFENRQWAMVNEGDFELGSVFDGDIDMDSAWFLTTGDSSVTVSILDSGLKLDHEDLTGRIWQNQSETPNNNDDDTNGYIDDLNGWDFVNSDNDPTDDNGHGTNVTGIIGANGNNNIGYAGVDWNCKLLTCKVTNASGSGFYSDWVSGIYYSVDNGADVINMSLSGANYSQSLQDAINYSFNNGVPVVVSMGNGDTNLLRYPAALNNVIAVGATSSNNERANPFSWGGGSNYGQHIDIVAPGNKIFGLNYQSSTNYNSYWSGTSQSTPFVTGVVALLKGVAPSFTAAYIKSLLTQNAVDNLGNPLEDTPGWDQYHGHGLLNAYQTLSQVINSSAEASITYDLQTACEPFTWIDNLVYTESNDSASVVFVNSVGCDSTIFLSLTIPKVDTTLTKVDSTTLESNVIGATYQWLDCDMGNTAIPGATSRSFTTFKDANFAVVVSENGCSDTSSCHFLKVNIATIDIDNVNLFDQVKIYPSRTNGELNISLSELKDVSINIFNVQGKLVYNVKHVNEKLYKMNLEVSSGIYFIEISNSLGEEVFKLVKR